MLTINHKPEDILKLAKLFMESRILLTTARLDLFTHVDPPSTAKSLAGRLNADLRISGN